MTWKYIEYNRDMTIYARCPNCDFQHYMGFYDLDAIKIIFAKPFKYCPMCGRYLKYPKFKVNRKIKCEEITMFQTKISWED